MFKLFIILLFVTVSTTAHATQFDEWFEEALQEVVEFGIFTEEQVAGIEAPKVVIVEDATARFKEITKAAVPGVRAFYAEDQTVYVDSSIADSEITDDHIFESTVKHEYVHHMQEHIMGLDWKKACTRDVEDQAYEFEFQLAEKANNVDYANRMLFMKAFFGGSCDVRKAFILDNDQW